MAHRDSQRSRVYRAESPVRRYLRRHRASLADLQEWVDAEILTDQWFRRRWPDVRHIELESGKANAYGAYDYTISTARIQLPRWAQHRMIVLHELAHVCTWTKEGWMSVADHGPEWACTYLDLIARYLGHRAYRRLESSFETNDVRFC